MLYISGSNEHVSQLKEKEEYKGTLADYLEKFNALNPHLFSKPTVQSGQLPSFMPMCLVSEPPASAFGTEEVLRELSRFSLLERQKLRDMQENNYDFPTLIALTEMMEQLQSYAIDFRNSLDNPLISTPWNTLNRSVTKVALVDIFSESAGIGLNSILRSNRFRTLDNLYENMMKRDALNLELFTLKNQRGSGVIQSRQNLEKQIKELTREIKQLLPKKLDSTMTKYLNNRMTPENVQKMRVDSFSKKMARKGRFATTNLDVLNRTGLSRLRTMIEKLKTVSDHAGAVSMFLGVGAVAFDTVQAYNNNKDVTRTLLTGAAGVGTGVAIGSAFASASSFGALTIGAFAGDVALSGTLLLCLPVVGWIVATAVGIAVTGYVAYQASEVVGEVWDNRQAIRDHVTSMAGYIYNQFQSAWSAGSGWLLDFYGAR